MSTGTRTSDVPARERTLQAGSPLPVRRRIAPLLARPEVGAAAGALLVWLVFALVAGPPFRSLEGTAAVLNAAAPLGILAVAVALLMIAGEFDLSIGSIIGVAGMTIMLLTRHFDWPLWPAIGVTVLLSLAIGLGNGYLVVRTGLPSFIVTLGTLFAFRGLTIAVSRLLTRRTQLGGLDEVAGVRTCAGALRQRRAGPVSGLDPLVDRPRRAGDLGPAPHPLRQLDLRRGRGARGGAKDGRARGAGEDRRSS